MAVTQISIFVENHPGRLAAVTNVLGDAGVDIQALSIADTAEFGVLRLIVNGAEQAAQVLRNAGFPVTLTQVLAVSVGNQPGGLAKALSALGGEITVEYCYAFIGRDPKCAHVILRVDDNAKAESLLRSAGFAVLDAQNLF